MNNFAKAMLAAFVLMYILSPLDAMPGPIDDLIVLMLGIAANKKLKDRSRNDI